MNSKVAALSCVPALQQNHHILLDFLHKKPTLFVSSRHLLRCYGV